MEIHRRSAASQRRRRAGAHGVRRQRGQSLAEFALVLTPLMLVLLGILQMGLILNAYVTISNATREGARAATVYLYDRTQSKATNDANREQAARTALRQAMGILSTNPPQLATSDLVVSYPCDGASPPPNCAPTSEPRSGQYVSVRTTYHLDILIPLIGELLPKDAGGRLAMTAQVTMVIN